MFIRSIRKSTEASVREFVNIPQTCHLSKENKINFFSKDFLSYKPTKRLKTVGINVSLLYLRKIFHSIFCVCCSLFDTILHITDISACEKSAWRLQDIAWPYDVLSNHGNGPVCGHSSSNACMRALQLLSSAGNWVSILNKYLLVYFVGILKLVLFYVTVYINLTIIILMRWRQ